MPESSTFCSLPVCSDNTETNGTYSAHEKETLEDFQVKHHKIHALAVVSLRVQLLKFQSSGPNKIVFLKRNTTHTWNLHPQTEQEDQGQKISPWSMFQGSSPV